MDRDHMTRWIAGTLGGSLIAASLLVLPASVASESAPGEPAPSASPTITAPAPSPSPSPGPSLAPSPSLTPEPESSPSPTQSVTPSASGSESPSPTVSASVSPTPTLSSFDDTAAPRIVVVRNGAYTQSAKDLVVELGGTPEKTLTGMVDGFTADLTDSQVAELEDNYAIEYIEDDAIISLNAGFRSVTKTTTSSLTGYDDASSGLQSLGFTANWFDTEYTGIYINTNGGAVLDDGLGPFASYRGIDLGAATRPFIFPLFTDLDARTQGTIQFGRGTISDSGTKNVFWAEWTNVGEYGIAGARHTFQMLLIHEGSGQVTVEYNYTTVSTAGSTTNPTFEVGFTDPAQVGTVEIGNSTESSATVATRLTSSGNPAVGSGGSAGVWRYSISPGSSPSPAPSPSPTDGIQTGATWGLDRIDQRSLPLSTTYGPAGNGSGVTAYIVDTGIRTTHTEFTGRIVTGRDEVDNDSDPTDCNGHGTHVASTVGGTAYGVAKAVSLSGVRVLNCSGSGYTSDVVAGLNWVRTNHTSGRAVVNMSLGGGASKSIDDAVAALVDANIPVVVAAGNSNADASNFSPAREPKAITVGATTNVDARASFSNFGSSLDIFAPGQSITGAWSTSNTATATISGTSMASPHVAGAAAMYLALNPTATAAQVATALGASATENVVTSPGTGSPNRLLYVAAFDGSSGGGSGDDSGSSSGGGGGGGGAFIPVGGGGGGSDSVADPAPPQLGNRATAPQEIRIVDLEGEPVRLGEAGFTQSGFRFAGDGWHMNGLGDLNSQNSALVPGASITFTGEGLERLTTVGIYVMSSPQWLASGVIGYDNKLLTSARIPNLEVGQHTLQVNLTPPGRSEISIAMGFTVSGAAPAESPTTPPAAKAPSESALLVSFRGTSTSLSAATKKKLRRIAAQARTSDANVHVVGFDATGEPTLGSKRAQAISRYLQAQGLTQPEVTTRPARSAAQAKSALIHVSNVADQTQDTVASLIVQFKKGTAPKVGDQFASDFTVGRYLGLRMYRLDFATPVPETSAQAVAAKLIQRSDVLFAEPDSLVRTQVSISGGTKP